MEGQLNMYILANQLQGQLLHLWRRLQILQERYLGLGVDDQLMELWRMLQTLQGNYSELFPRPLATYAAFDLEPVLFPDLHRVNARLEEIVDPNVTLEEVVNPSGLELDLPHQGTAAINLGFPDCTIWVNGKAECKKTQAGGTEGKPEEGCWLEGLVLAGVYSIGISR
ncbi:hypothetical protein R1sor_010496 [Riccia sorocarpa]|uniref:Uncharacterized protein n=1 Tax=Riccia sorocarpa TaxID=122646 RepID=A0ABD3HY68_9MARC